ncbi:cytochrome b [Anthocerotibacter panamensis]|uniref:cytochrome b n=1 Tax=Anthocerotibacter panamensis TaxID=2857077 RepID=UPI001C406091|nr:cytochrome b [Anthocerotibacter panamensis]
MLHTTKRQIRNQLWIVHWTMAIAFTVIFTVGLYMVNLPDKDPSAGFFFDFHKSMGVLVMFLLTARIFLVLRNLGPARPKNWLVTAALHTALYVFMVVVPLSGYFLSNTSGYGVALFGLPMPTLFGKDRALSETATEVHVWLAYTFAAFVGVHLLAQRKFMMATWRRLTARRIPG